MSTRNGQPLHAAIRSLLGDLLNSTSRSFTTDSSAAHKPTDYDAVLEACASIVKIAEEVQSDFRRRRNALLPINRIPTEILSRTLSMAVHIAADPEWKYYDELRNLRLVSTRWADVIDGSKSFWSPAYCHDAVTETNMAIEKSRGGPLDVGFLCRDIVSEVGRSQHNHRAFYDTIIKEAQRWRSLKIRHQSRGDEDDDEDYMDGVFVVEMPHLKSLDASFKYDCELADPLFAGCAPKLEHVTLRRLSVFWDAEVLHNLKSLSLQKIKEPAPSVNDLMAIMASPILEELDIVDCLILPSPNPYIAPSDRPVTLPSLTSVSVYGVSYDTALVLRPLVDHHVAPKLNSFILDITRFSALEIGDSDHLLEPAGHWIAAMQQTASLPPLELRISASGLQIGTSDENIAVSLACDGWVDMAWLAVLQDLNEHVRSAVKSIKIQLLQQSEQELLQIISFLGQTFTNVTSAIIDCLRLSAVMNLLGAPNWYFPQMTSFTVCAYHQKLDPVLRLLQDRAQASQGEHSESRLMPLEALTLDGGSIGAKTLDAILAFGITLNRKATIVVA